MKRVVLLTVAISLLFAGATMPAAAQEDATELSDCNPDSDTFEDCLREHTTAQDVLDWIQKAPDELTANQKSAIHIFDAERASLSKDARAKLTDWRRWDAGAEMPEWFGSTGETETPTPDEEGEQSESESENASSDDVNKYREIRPGQWIVEEPEFYDGNETGKLVVYSEFDGRIALVDNGDCDGGMRVCKPDVTNSEVAAGETTTIWFDASPKNGTLDNGNQAVTLNSLTNERGAYELAVMLLSDDDEPFFSKPLWDYVWIVAVVSTLTMAGLVLAMYTYIWWSSRRLDVNGFEYLAEHF